MEPRRSDKTGKNGKTKRPDQRSEGRGAKRQTWCRNRKTIDTQLRNNRMEQQSAESLNEQTPNWRLATEMVCAVIIAIVCTSTIIEWGVETNLSNKRQVNEIERTLSVGRSALANAGDQYERREYLIGARREVENRIMGDRTQRWLGDANAEASTKNDGIDHAPHRHRHQAELPQPHPERGRHPRVWTYRHGGRQGPHERHFRA